MKKLSLQELNRKSVDAFKSAKKHTICVVLDNIRSANNVGSVFRTSDAFLIEGIHLCGFTAKPPHKEIRKTAIGATDSVDWTYHEKVANCLTQLKQDGYTLIAIEQADKSIPLNDFDWQANGKYALIMGNEVKGVSNEAMELIDYCIEIPQFGTKHSLNVSVCTGIVLWDAVKNRL